MSIIEVKQLTKKFGSFTALTDLNLEVNKGEVHGFLGPNGSGKSTTIRILLGLLKKSSGTAKLFDQDPWSQPAKLHGKLAYVPGDVNFWPNLTGGEIIDLLGNLRGGLDEKRRASLLKRFELDPTKKFHTYSKGNRQKVALVAALASDVPLYILDEPTSGLDPLMEQVFQEEIRELKKQEKTVLLSSHILSEAEALCDRVTIIREGKTISVYTLTELKKEHENLEALFLSKYGEE
jgi:ABC-type multidrug transport system, ATPase component